MLGSHDKTLIGRTVKLKPQEKAASNIRRMFAEISPRYDLLNHLLSLNLDRSWRRRAVTELKLRPGAQVLDICTGTADLALECAARDPSPRSRVLGSDFTPEMIRIGETKRRARRANNLTLLVADSLHLPFPDSVFDAVTVAFGIRNVSSLDAALHEILRILKPGGKAAILEFSTPGRGWFRHAFGFYFRHLLPRVGGWISGVRAGADAYTYLPTSVNEWPSPQDFSKTLQQCGFSSVRHLQLTFGVATLHMASRSPTSEGT